MNDRSIYGKRCRLSAYAKEYGIGTKKTREREGVVIRAVSGDRILIRWEGNKNGQTYHKDFIEIIEDAEYEVVQTKQIENK